MKTSRYQINGMTCTSCKSQVESYLKSLPGVQDVEVSLESKLAKIISTAPVKITEVQKVLPAKYKVSDHFISESDTSSLLEKDVLITSKKDENFKGVQTEDATSKIKQLKPLLLIFFYLIMATLFINRNSLFVGEMMLDFMGLFFIVFSFFKILDIEGFKESFSMYDPLAKKLDIYGFIYPFLEIGLGVCFLTRNYLTPTLIITLFILGITTVGVMSTLLNKKKIQCACLGTALNLPMTEATFIENTIMIVMAVSMLLL
ncbi:cation transporter [Aquimarina sp. ERC-38]|uniref:heavy-metal-associated domain-containing protein n=1 Tax=Aquimarina sp. ERC-38 TaxID=2949996 RepID=UPI0022473F58|nr:MauE/DoxX family redox-associated membrane protein [Aquimarina sp. ERC-38]UZO80860.1 cation transporter [Aquimarina sp. ERC-38]